MNPPRIETSREMQLVGMRLTMSMSNNQTPALWRSFMPRLNEVQHRLGTDRISAQTFASADFFSRFNPDAPFQKWATVEVSNLENIPEGMETLTIAEGLYAVFHYKGTPANFGPTAQWIYGVWLPNSEYALDLRPHFEILTENYNPTDPEAEEDIWIPIRPK